MFVYVSRNGAPWISTSSFKARITPGGWQAGIDFDSQRFALVCVSYIECPELAP